MLKRAHVRALLLACIPVAVTVGARATVQPAAQDGNRADRLTLDQFLEMETVSEPQLSPDGAQIVYTRGWIDKMNDKRESALWIMNVDGSRNRFLVKGSGARWSPTGDRIAYTTPGEPKGLAGFRALDGRRGRGLANHPRRAGAFRAGLVAGRQTAVVHDAGRRQDQLADQDAKGASRRQMDRDTADCRAPQLPARSIRIHRQRLPPDLRRAGQRRYSASAHERKLPIRAAATGHRTARAYSSAAPRDRTTTSGASRISTRWTWPTARSASSRPARDLTATPRFLLTAVASPTRGYDQTTDTWTDSKIYVMNIDGSGAHLVSGDWDRAPAEMRWSPDGSGRVLHGAERRKRRTSTTLPLAGDGAGKVTDDHQGHADAHRDATSRPRASRSARSSTAQQPGDIVTFDLKSPATIKQLTAVNEDVLPGRSSAKSDEMLVHVARRHQDRGLDTSSRRTSMRRRNIRCMLHIHGGPHSMYGVGFNFGWQEQRPTAT